MSTLRLIFWLGGMLLACAVVGGQENPSWPTNAPALVELQDQFGKPQKLAFPNSKVTLLAIADKKGSIEVNAWIAALKPRYAWRIDIRGLPDLGGVPGFLQGHICRKFQATRWMRRCRPMTKPRRLPRPGIQLPHEIRADDIACLALSLIAGLASGTGREFSASARKYSDVFDITHTIIFACSALSPEEVSSSPNLCLEGLSKSGESKPPDPNR